MSSSIFALPVSVEQIAAAIKQMSPTDWQRLLDLVPELRQAAIQAPSRTADEALAVVEQVRMETMQALGSQSLPPSLPFLGNLTLEQYLWICRMKIGPICGRNGPR